MSHYVTSGNKAFVVGSSALTAGQIVKLGTSGDAGKIVPAAAATDKILGVVNSAAKIGWQTDVRLRSSEGTLSVVVGAGGSIAVGDAVTSDSSGLGVTTTTSGNQILGYALEAGAPGAFVELLPSTAKV